MASHKLSCSSRLLGSGLLARLLCTCAAEWGSDFEISGFDVLLKLIESGALRDRLPGWKPAVEHFVHFFQRLTLRLGGCQEHVDERCAVECCEDHVHLPVACLLLAGGQR
jgi:hypothetical protein